jgi:predicted regulator of Ras-like GTPase activity (Roadblock/LC7/MglB family)
MSVSNRRLTSMDWLLRDLAESVPGLLHIVVLSADGLCIARHSTERDTADRLAAAASGIKSLAQSVAREFPEEDRALKTVLLELDPGYFLMMSAGDRSYLAVTSDGTINPGHIGRCMRDLVARIGEHLSSAPRDSDRVTP